MSNRTRNSFTLLNYLYKVFKLDKFIIKSSDPHNNIAYQTWIDVNRPLYSKYFTFIAIFIMCMLIPFNFLLYPYSLGLYYAKFTVLFIITILLYYIFLKKWWENIPKNNIKYSPVLALSFPGLLIILLYEYWFFIVIGEFQNMLFIANCLTIFFTTIFLNRFWKEQYLVNLVGIVGLIAILFIKIELFSYCIFLIIVHLCSAVVAVFFRLQHVKSMRIDSLEIEQNILNNELQIAHHKAKISRKLIESEEKFKILFDFAPDGIYLIDQKGTFIDGNNTAQELLGYKKEELIGKSFLKLKLLAAEDLIKATKNLMINIQGKSTGPDEYNLIRKDGSQIPVEIRTHPIKIKNQKMVLGIARDNSERKQAEKELHKYRDHLEDLIEERNQELEAFANSVSHDMGAPLRAINGFTKILIEDYTSKLDKKGKRLGTVIQQNTQKMRRLISGLRIFVGIGQKSMVFVNIDMKSMVNAMYHETTDAEERKQIKFTIEDMPHVRADTTMMRQVWMHLISNAVKFSSKREKSTISVSGKVEKNKLIYCIKDNGVGFNMQYAQKLFSLFDRLHLESEFEGHGAGLALVQRIIQRHKGEVWAEGKIDKGAAFYFSLPN